MSDFAQSSLAVADFGMNDVSFDSTYAVSGFWYPKCACDEPMRQAQPADVSVAPPPHA